MIVPIPPVRESLHGLSQVVTRNIHALLHRERDEERRRTQEERIADRITSFAGSMRFVYLHAILFGLWILVNVGWLPLPRFDPSFVILAMFASVEAIFLSTFVLITQNRMAEAADKRADLDVQISLLAEHEISRLIELVKKVAEKLEVEGAHDAELDELVEDVAPERVLDEIERSEEKILGKPKAS